METQVLDLSGNNLQILPREVFARHGLLNLQKLHLSDCKIGQIDPTAFRGLTNLVEINLAGNLLTTIPTATFAGKPFLLIEIEHFFLDFLCYFQTSVTNMYIQRPESCKVMF